MVADFEIPHFKLGSTVRFAAHMLANRLRKKVETPEFPSMKGAPSLNADTPIATAS